MTAEQQVQEIINLLAPENPNQVDAVFLVTQKISKLTEEIKKKDKQLAKMEAEITVDRGTIHRLRNEKLALINGSPREAKEENQEGRDAGDSRVKNTPTGETL